MRRRRLKTGALLLALLALGGFLGVAAGLVPIAASSGHWRITAWFLHFAMRRAVATRTLGDELPPRDEPWLVLKGAGHYEGACRPCHGRPEEPLPPVPQAMTPHPPRLGPELTAEWEPEELFYVVKHGIKFTGMPGWPTQQRDDEVVAMVAFLLKLPDLDAAGYRRLVHGDDAPAFVAEPLPELARRHCARCHGLDGCGRDSPAFPRLAGQSRAYLGAALHAYADGQRHSGIMRPIAAGLSGDQRDELAGYYSDQPVCPPLGARSDAGSAAAIARGRQLAEHGAGAQRVPACVDCHGPGRPRRNAHMPDLAGQYADYLALQLELFKARRRGGSAYAHLMHPVSSALDPDQIRDHAADDASRTPHPDQIRDLAAYYASLTPAP